MTKSGMWRLLGAIYCGHSNRIRYRDPEDGTRWLVCESCGDRTEMISRSQDERDLMAERFRLTLPPKATKAKKVKRAAVVPMRQAK